MATLTHAAIRQRIRDALDAITGWTESAWALDAGPLEPGRFAHLRFTVGLTESTWDGIETVRRKRGADGGLMASTYSVRFLSGMRGDGHPASLDEATGHLQDAVKAITGMSSTDLHVEVGTLRGRIVADGTWWLGEIEINTLHRYAIQ